MDDKYTTYREEVEKKRPRGRPNTYEPRYVKMAYEIMCLGATIPKLASIFGVNTDTIYDWRKKHADFSDAIQRGRDEFDSDNVEKALMKRAVGFRYTENTEELTPGGMKLTKKIKKYVPPSDQAVQFWLKNRRPKRWPKNGDLGDAAAIVYYSKEMIDKMMAEEKEDINKIKKKVKK